MDADLSGDMGPDWDRRYDLFIRITPWPLLILPTILVLAQPGQSWRDRAVTLALVGCAAAWVYGMHTRVPPECRDGKARGLVYFAGLIAIGIALMARDVIFLLFSITGFLHAYQLRPLAVGVAGVFATSVSINTASMGVPANVRDAGVYFGVIAIQTVAIGSGIVVAEKSAEQHRRRKEMVLRLEAALQENAGLHTQLLTQAREAGVLDERQRLAGEIHDSLAQGLTGIITQVQAAQRVWHSPEQAREHVDRALGLAKESLAEARRSVQALGPRRLEEAHLPDALRDLAQRWGGDVQAAVAFEVTGDRMPLSPAIEVALFRVTQEALHNVARHAKASRVGVTLSYLDSEVLLDIRDDGRGIPAHDGKGFGLTSMRQRVRGVGGTLEIETAPGDGTAISVRVPAVTLAAQ